MRLANSNVRNPAADSSVLVVDDDPSMLHTLRSVLEANGYKCLTAGSGEEALAILRSRSDVVVALSDINMPGMNGMVFLEAIASYTGLASRPRVLFITAHTELEYAVAALRLGAVDFLRKPVTPMDLLGAVSKAVDRAQQEQGTLQLSEHALTLARQVEALADAFHIRPPRHSAPQEEAGVTRADRGTEKHHAGPSSPMNVALLGLDRLRRLRQSLTRLRDLDEVTWDLLLQLLRAENNSQRLSVSALSISVEHASHATASRRIQKLVDAGHIIRHPDLTDARRDFVTLAPESRAALERYLESVAQELAEVGGPRAAR